LRESGQRQPGGHGHRQRKVHNLPHGIPGRAAVSNFGRQNQTRLWPANRTASGFSFDDGALNFAA
jgi:hypothetical protein